MKTNGLKDSRSKANFIGSIRLNRGVKAINPRYKAYLWKQNINVDLKSLRG